MVRLFVAFEIFWTLTYFWFHLLKSNKFRIILHFCCPLEPTASNYTHDRSPYHLPLSNEEGWLQITNNSENSFLCNPTVCATNAASNIALGKLFTRHLVAEFLGVVVKGCDPLDIHFWRSNAELELKIALSFDRAATMNCIEVTYGLAIVSEAANCSKPWKRAKTLNWVRNMQS